MKKMTRMEIGVWALLCLGSALAFGAEKITWEHILLGPGGGFMMIKIAPRNDDVVYISSDMSNWGKSVDGGTTWTDLTPAQLEATGRGGLQDYGLLIDPTDPNTLYLASGGVAKSVDGGKSWKLIFDAHASGSGSELTFATRMAMDPTNPKVMYLGGYAGHMIKTENAGDTWTKLPGTGWGEFRKGQGDLISIVVGQDHVVYACMYGKGIFRSADGGQTWTTNNVGLPHQEIGSLQAAAGKGKSVLYALLVQAKDKSVTKKGIGKASNLEGGLYRSVNGATSWEKIKVLDEEKYMGRKSPIWCQMAVSPANADVVYLTANNVLEDWVNSGTYRTFDGGKTWEFLAGKNDRNLLYWDPDMYPYMGYYGDVFAVSPRNPKKLYRAGSACAFRSDDGGESWQKLSQEDAGEGYYRSTGLENICVMGITVDPKDSRRIYLGAVDNGLFKSRDGGKTWKGGLFKGLGIRTERTDQILVDPDTPSTLYIGSAWLLNGHFAISRDYGDSWEKSEFHPEWGLPKIANIVALALDPDSSAGSRVLYASLIGEGVWKTANGGLNWKPCHKGLPEVNREDLRKNALGRQIIQLVKPKGTEIVYAVVCEKAGLFLNMCSMINPASVEGHGLYITENKGETWNQVQFEGTVPAVIKEIAVDPKNPAILYAACNKEGVWKSMDKGKTWKKVLSVEPGVPFYQVAVDNFNSSRVYAAGVIRHTSNFGMWMSEDGGGTWTHENKGFGHRSIDVLYADPTAEGIIWAGTTGNAVFKGYVKGAAAPKEIKEPARSPLEEIKSPLKALTDTETLEQIKAASLSAGKADGPMTIDGDLAEPAWAKATGVTGFYNTRSRTPAEKQTTVKALYDNEFLYLSIVCQEPNPNLVKAESKKHDGDVWNDDAVEVFIAKGLKGDVFQFIVNAAGSRFDAAYGRSLICDTSWNPAPDWKSVAKKGKAEWTVEMAIPLKAVTVPGGTDEPWRIKICRDEQMTPAVSSWPASVKPEFVCPPALFASVMLEPAGTVK